MSNIHEIIEQEAARCGVEVSDIIGPSRQGHIVAARWNAVCRARYEVRATLKAIGRAINRDHKTVLHALRSHG